MINRFEEYLERGDIIFLDKHISEIEARILDAKDSLNHLSMHIYELNNTISNLNKIRDVYNGE